MDNDKPSYERAKNTVADVLSGNKELNASEYLNLRADLAMADQLDYSAKGRTFQDGTNQINYEKIASDMGYAPSAAEKLKGMVEKAESEMHLNNATKMAERLASGSNLANDNARSVMNTHLESAGLTTADIAEKLGTTQQAIDSKIENGIKHQETNQAIAGLKDLVQNPSEDIYQHNNESLVSYNLERITGKELNVRFKPDSERSQNVGDAFVEHQKYTQGVNSAIDALEKSKTVNDPNMQKALQDVAVEHLKGAGIVEEKKAEKEKEFEGPTAPTIVQNKQANVDNSRGM